MKSWIMALALIVAPAVTVAAETRLKLPDMPLHDPWIVADKTTQTYYLYNRNEAVMTGVCTVGTMVYTSRDLKTWTPPQVVFSLPEGIWASNGAWAPEVHEWKGKYYLFTTLHNEALAIEGPAKPNRKPYRRGTVLAVSDRLEGPFSLVNGGEPVAPADLMTLDGTLYVDPQGKPWYVYAHEWLQATDGTIAALPLDDDLKAAGDPFVLFKASDAPWPQGQKTGVPGDAVYVTDGPELFHSSDGSLLMLWSSWGPGNNGKSLYVQSIARSKSGTVAGPWEQLPPLLGQDSGHGMIFDRFEGGKMMVVHRPFNNARGKLYEVRDTGNSIELVRQRIDLDGGDPPRETPVRTDCQQD